MYLIANDFKYAAAKLGLNPECLSITTMRSAINGGNNVMRVSYYEWPHFNPDGIPLASYEVDVRESATTGIPIDKFIYRQVVDILKQIAEVDVAVKKVKDKINGTGAKSINYAS